MKFCPQCGTSLKEGDVFCEQCGFKIEHEVPVSSSVQPNVPPQDIPIIPPPQPADYQNQQSAAGVYQPLPANVYEPVPKKKSKLVPILIIIGAIIILGGGGWLVYANFFKAKTEVVVSDSSNVMAPETPTAVPDTTANVSAQQPAQTPVSAVDNAPKQEVPSQPGKATTTTSIPSKAKVETKTVSKPTTPVKTPVKVNEPAKEIKPDITSQPATNVQPTTSEKVVPPSTMIFQVGQLGLSILKNPMKDCVFTLKDKYCITRITTDHYNSGNGTARTGTIGIEDTNGRLIKQWNARGRSGTNGASNCKWVVEPGIILDAGNYTIIDSDRETWSKKISGVGFVLIEGYKVQ